MVEALIASPGARLPRRRSHRFDISPPTRCYGCRRLRQDLWHGQRSTVTMNPTSDSPPSMMTTTKIEEKKKNLLRRLAYAFLSGRTGGTGQKKAEKSARSEPVTGSVDPPVQNVPTWDWDRQSTSQSESVTLSLKRPVGTASSNSTSSSKTSTFPRAGAATRSCRSRKERDGQESTGDQSSAGKSVRFDPSAKEPSFVHPAALSAATSLSAYARLYPDRFANMDQNLTHFFQVALMDLVTTTNPVSSAHSSSTAGTGTRHFSHAPSTDMTSSTGELYGSMKRRPVVGNSTITETKTWLLGRSPAPLLRHTRSFSGDDNAPVPARQMSKDVESEKSDGGSNSLKTRSLPRTERVPVPATEPVPERPYYGDLADILVVLTELLNSWKAAEQERKERSESEVSGPQASHSLSDSETISQSQPSRASSLASDRRCMTLTSRRKVPAPEEDRTSLTNSAKTTTTQATAVPEEKSQKLEILTNLLIRELVKSSSAVNNSKRGRATPCPSPCPSSTSSSHGATANYVPQLRNKTGSESQRSATPSTLSLRRTPPVAEREELAGNATCWDSPIKETALGRLGRSSITQAGLQRSLQWVQAHQAEGLHLFRHRHLRIAPADCNTLFLYKMSDDDRMSLTTAVSDDDDGESEADVNSHGHTKKSVAAASFNCTGALRKAGFLSVKKWLLRKKHQVELARKRGWRGYWVCLKGTTLLFYPCDSREGRTVEAAPKHLIIVDGAIMQPIPEHPKRDFIFCLSTAFGDAYLFQAPCQAELDTWVNSIHCACAASFARHRGKTGTLHLLQEEIFRLERSIESDNKLKHMAEMQLSVVSDPENRRQIGAQISAWEENLERLHCEQFRLRCYMASLQHGELPNPKGLLAHVSRNTKGILNRLGVFTVSSFHAYICARSPSLLNNLLAGRGATRRRAAPPLSRSNSVSSRKSQSLVATPAASENEQLFKVNVPDSQHVTITIRDSMTVEEFLSSACTKRSLNPAEHFVRVKKRRDMDNSNHFVPHRSDLIESYIHSHEVVEVCAKSLYQVELSRSSLDHMWGFSVEAELVENMDRQDELCCFVSRVEDRSVAMTNGIIKSDEIMVINGALVGDLDMMYIESVLQEELSLCLMMRSCRADPPDITCLLKTTDDIIDSLVCPPPPSDALITDDVISGLIVPAPSWSREVQSPGEVEVYRDRFAITRQSAPEIVGLLKVMEGDRNVCRSSSSSEARRSSPTGSVASSQSQVMTPNRQLTDAEKLRKVVLELIETERTYVKNLNALLENYLEPLKQETFLSTAEINVLFGNIQEIVAFQRLFLQSLEEALHGQPDFERWDQTRQFKAVLLSIGNSFLYYAQHFKLYSSFCASHSKAQKVLLPNEGSQALQEFLTSRNPKQQHSSTLESYLIKPIQRILKYPLLLQQLKILTEPNSEEHQLLIEALKSMEKVAEHINEMQRIHEEYGAIFEHLFRQHQKSCKQPVDLSPGDLLYYGGVEWLNISDFLGKVKKGLELHAMCFVFKTAVVFLCKERLRQKKKLMSVATKASAPEVEIIRYQVLIPVTEVQVRAAATKDLDAHFLWELIHLKNPLHRRSEKVYHLSNSTAEFRNAFLKTIRQIIRESVRNMSIPPAKPGNTVLASSPRLLSSSSSSSGNPKTLSLASGAGSLRRKSPRNAQRHSAGNIDYDNLEPAGNSTSEEANFGGTLRARSQTVGDGIDCIGGGNGKDEQKDSDPGAKSESEDEPPPPKAMLGRTPNHLSLSTTSTLSTGSTSSQAKLIQSSNTPQNYQPQYAKPLGSPIWKPRDIGESFTLPRSTRSGATNNTSTRDQPLRATGDLSKSMYGTLTPGHDQSTHSFY